MYISTLVISPKGQIVLPKKVRNLFNSNIISLEINNNHQVILSPVHDLGGSLSSYKKDSNLSFQQIREQVWNNEISYIKNFDNKDPQ